MHRLIINEDGIYLDDKKLESLMNVKIESSMDGLAELSIKMVVDFMEGSNSEWRQKPLQ
ncbi:hypothetical protein [Suicoccus acidiformans]|uniref:hypothetical protein n=1 Tax=Suicoccus acidiformans TaxID=2036206 RepID=UPI0013C31D26|nr:hypothetical protein [Suicoccus acidiformans]